MTTLIVAYLVIAAATAALQVSLTVYINRPLRIVLNGLLWPKYLPMLLVIAFRTRR